MCTGDVTKACISMAKISVQKQAQLMHQPKLDKGTMVAAGTWTYGSKGQTAKLIL